MKMKNDFRGLKAALVAVMTLLQGGAYAQCVTPTVVTALPSQLCAPGGTINLNASSNAGTSIGWYTVPTGGTSIGTSLSGANFNTSAASTTTFYAQAFTISTTSITFNSTGAVQIFTAPATGNYTFQAWGAKGGNDGLTGANGGYAAGVYALNAGQTVAIYAGGLGIGCNTSSGGGWNGGGNAGPNGCSGGGGGASDIRFGGTNFANRILVAGGGGGGGNSINAGAGGGLTGDGYGTNTTSGGSQTAGGTGGNGNGALGQGGNHTGDGGGGGGGYYGGSAGNGDNGGGGGSSYIAGVSNGTTIAGSQSMPNPSGGTMTGNNGAGVVRVIYPGVGCTSPSRAAVVFTVNSNPTITVNSGAICVGQNFTINPSGASTYTIQGGNPVVNPSINATFTVTGTNAAGCVSQAFTTSSVTVNPNPIITVNSGAICAGQPFTINPNGASTYTIQGGNTVVNPSANTTYTVAGTSAAGCVSQAFATSSVTVNANPTITVNSGAICAGQSFTINPAGASTYTIQGGNPVVSPSANTTYTVRGTSAAGCVSQAFATSSLTVNANPTITVNSGAICVGQNFTINPTGASTYTIQGGNTVVNPAINATYTVTGASATGCLSQAFATSSVNVNPNPIITVNSGAICAGQNFTITPNGANTYTIQGGNAVVSPSGNTTYTVAGTSAAGCVSQAFTTSSVTVNANPTITVNSGAICAGQNFTINPTGASSYSIQGGNAVVSPSANTTYTVRGTNAAGCVSQAFATTSLTVNANPSITVNSGAICAGQSFTILPAGATTYTIQGGNAVVSPSGNSTYTVAGTSAAGCVSQAFTTSSVTVNANPTITVNSGAICAGQAFTINPSGANTYTIQGANAVVSPSANSTYTVMGTNTLTGCRSQSFATSNLTVNANPTVSISGPTGICTGQNATLTANGAPSYTWSTGATNSSIVTTPTANTTYTLTGSTPQGCSSFTTQLVNVQSSLSVSIAGPSSVCFGQTANLSGLGGVTYTWNTGANTASVAPTLTTTTTFSVIGASGTCSNTAIKTITVTPNPTVSISGTTAICSGLNASLTVSGATSYTWSTLSTDSSIVVSPSATTVYSVVGSFSTGCFQLASQTVSVYALPVVSISGPSVVCEGDSITLNANGADTYVWDNAATTASIVVSPTATSSYSAIGTTTDGCSGSASTSVTVNPVPVMSVVKTTSAICQGDSLSFTATGADTYLWNTGATSNSIVVTPTSSANYSVVGTNTFGCTSLVIDSVKVNALPVLTITGNTGTICIGETIVLDLNGADTYSWSTGASTSSISVSPSVASTYSATGTSTDACVSAITATVEVSECTSLTDFASATTAKVYPNPSNGEFTLELSSVNKSVITITSVLGQVVLTQEADLIQQINLSELNKGMYFINVTENNKSVFRTNVVKQ